MSRKNYKDEHLNNTREYTFRTKLLNCQNLIKFTSHLSNFRHQIIDSIQSLNIEILKELIVLIYDNGSETPSRLERSKHIINDNLLTISSLLEILYQENKIQVKSLEEFKKYYDTIYIC